MTCISVTLLVTCATVEPNHCLYHGWQTFSIESNNKYFRLCELQLCGLCCQLLTSAAVAQKNECSYVNKILFIQTRSGPIWPPGPSVLTPGLQCYSFN